MNKINLTQKFALVTEHWRPKIIAEFNGQSVKLAKFKGEFVWHRHDAVDELFVAWKGSFRIEFRNKVVRLQEGEMFLVPRGVEHRTIADEEAEVLLIEPSSTRNTGDVIDQNLTSPGDEWI